MTRPLVTAADLARMERVELPPGALLTPLARDVLRKRGLLPVAGGGPLVAPDRLVIANWKSHKTLAEAAEFARAFRAGRPAAARATPVICPPFTALSLLREGLAGAAELGAQDVSPHGEGAHTGEVAARHLVDVGCAFALVGHSERRHAGEDDARCRAKLRAALAGGLRPVLCVGETAEERRAGRTQRVVSDQLRAALDGLEPARAAQVVIAYEPRWAIGKGVTPTPAEVTDVLAHARAILERACGDQAAARMPVLYGGSVDERNAGDLLSLSGCAGALVGGASLKAERLLAILAAA